jgi:ribosome-interacting GTPase 1
MRRDSTRRARSTARSVPANPASAANVPDGTALDRIDCRILLLLQEEGPITNAELAAPNKSDLDTDPDEVQVLEELTGARFPAIPSSAKTGHGLDHLARFLFESLQIMRVYTKPPGQPPDRSRPFTVRRGDTVFHVARLVHQDIASRLKLARLWGSGAFEGQLVGPEHLVADGDV